MAVATDGASGASTPASHSPRDFALGPPPQLFRACVCGGGCKFGESTTTWKSALLKWPPNQGKLRWPPRISRRQAPGGHRRAAVHLHGLTCILAKSVACVQLEGKVSASVRFVARQTGRAGSSWLQRRGESAHDPAADRMLLRHSALDKQLGVRGHIRRSGCAQMPRRPPN